MKMGKGTKILLTILVTALLTLTMMAALYRPDIKLNSGDYAQVEAGDNFDAESVAQVILHSKLTLLPDLPTTISVGCRTTNVSTDSIRDREAVFYYSFFGKTMEKTVTVRVVDTTGPVIQLMTDPSLHFTLLSGYIEEGFTATDVVDGDITDRTVISSENGEVVYTCTDSSGNTTVARRHVEYDKAEPVFIDPYDTVTVYTSAYLEFPMIKAEDGYGNDISQLIRTKSDIVPVPGTYTVEYYIRDDLGAEFTYSRDVQLVRDGKGYCAPYKKTVYLTFDDGPSQYTSKLLDILDLYDVKVTFFVTATRPDYLDMIAEESRRGHKIAAHTYCHEYSVLYEDEDAYFRDLGKIEEIIKQQTGEYTKLIRFPGGSSNTVSSDNPGLMTRLVSEVGKRGYRYFDWNISSGDGRKLLTTQEVYENVVSRLEKRDVSIVLQHDTKEWSIDAVEMIIRWCIEHDYHFAVLDEYSMQAAHRINN